MRRRRAACRSQACESPGQHGFGVISRSRGISAEPVASSRTSPPSCTTLPVCAPASFRKVCVQPQVGIRNPCLLEPRAAAAEWRARPPYVRGPRRHAEASRGNSARCPRTSVAARVPSFFQLSGSSSRLYDAPIELRVGPVATTIDAVNQVPRLLSGRAAACAPQHGRTSLRGPTVPMYSCRHGPAHLHKICPREASRRVPFRSSRVGVHNVERPATNVIERVLDARLPSW